MMKRAESQCTNHTKPQIYAFFSEGDPLCPPLKHTPLCIKIPSTHLFQFQFIVQSAKPTMQNVECEMQNEGVAYGDLFQSFPKEIPQFCILHFEFCMSCVSTINCNLPFERKKPEGSPLPVFTDVLIVLLFLFQTSHYDIPNHPMQHELQQ